VLLIVVLNLTAITIRNHLREKYRSESRLSSRTCELSESPIWTGQTP
jgi:hypothetical protein